jgi:hypothetical protein
MSFNDTIHNIILKQKKRLEKILNNMDIVTKNNIPDMKVLNQIYEVDTLIENLEYKMIFIKSLISGNDNELLTHEEKQELNEEKIQKKINEIVLPYALFIRLHINNNIKF